MPTLMTAFDGIVVPTRADPANFPARGDDMMSRFPPFQTQINTITGEVNLNTIAAAASQVAAAASAAAAAASEAGAAAGSSAPQWVSGQNITAGNVRWSPADPNKFSYRAKVNLTPSTVDPYNDSANWSVLTVTPFNAVEVLAITGDTSLSASSKNVVRVSSTVKYSSVLLPSGLAIAGRTGVYTVKNIGNLPVPIRDQSGTLLSVLPGGASGVYTCHDFTTSASQWGVLAPDSRVGVAYTPSTIEALAATRIEISDIPGVANKALLLWVRSDGTVRTAIATRNPSTNAITLGAAISLTAANTQGYGAMAAALSSTTALVAASNAAATAWVVTSLTLDTAANTVTSVNTASVAGTPNGHLKNQVQRLDANRAAWLVSGSSGTLQMIIASYGNPPTASLYTMATDLGAAGASSIVHVGGGNLLGVGGANMTLWSTSGNNKTILSQKASSTSWFPTGNNGVQSMGFSQGSNNAAFVHAVSETNMPTRDKTSTVKCTGNVLPNGPSGMGSFPSGSIAPNGGFSSMLGFTIGSSYCMSSVEFSNYSYSLRVMRYTDDSLTELAFGIPADFPISTVGVTGVPVSCPASGQAAFTANSNESGFPQIFSMEVIKA